MSTKIPIYENPEIEIYTDCFDEDSLFVKFKNQITLLLKEVILTDKTY